MNFDVKNVVKKISKLEATLKNKIESGVLFDEVKRFADGQTKVLRQRVKSSKDAKKVIAFIEKRKKQIEKIAADLPGEVKVMRSYILTQRRELEKLGNDLLKKAKEGKLDAETLRTAIRKATTKKAAPRRRSSVKKVKKTKTSRKMSRKK